ncbi:hypothetical protein [Nitrosomonas ureae]|uniref:Uncharacterized protein n=1 Tax=Nitrosomonas ureae TaxID=44577 RepID=A0A286A3S3_9PROT|nr:hypothetical protein [Nitrosomonas ureae]SOD16517.1 hypothetical protein SAMN06297164_0602 [Nitrosomonas ureae]
MNKLKIIDLRTNGIVFIKVLEEVELIILRQSPDLFFDSIWFEVNVQKEVIRENRSNYKMIVIDDYNNFISGWPKARVISLEDYK